MAASLAARIKNEFDLTAQLIEGHDGIYTIVVNNTIVYSNQACEHPPVDEDVFAEISKYKVPRPVSRQSDDKADAGSAPFCAWQPPATPG